MNQHKIILESFGITQLSGLGMLKIDRDVIVQSGLLRPGSKPRYATTPTAIREAWVYNSTISMLRRGSSTAAFQLNTEAFPAVLRLGTTPAALVRRASGQVFREDAYWAAETIELADDTVVTFKYPNCYLTVLCEKLIVGKNMTLHGSVPGLTRRLHRPRRTRSLTPVQFTGNTVEDGDDGVAGNKGNDGHAAPELEIWVLEMSGKPLFDLSGQDGGRGGRGGNGGDAANGGDGKPAKVHFGIDALGMRLAICDSGPGDGGNGGKCGRPGLGGYGGNGGHGGELMLYAPKVCIEFIP